MALPDVKIKRIQCHYESMSTCLIELNLLRNEANYSLELQIMRGLEMHPHYHLLVKLLGFLNLIQFGGSICLNPALISGQDPNGIFPWTVQSMYLKQTEDHFPHLNLADCAAPQFY